MEKYSIVAFTLDSTGLDQLANVKFAYTLEAAMRTVEEYKESGEYYKIRLERIYKVDEWYPKRKNEVMAYEQFKLLNVNFGEHEYNKYLAIIKKGFSLKHALAYVDRFGPPVPDEDDEEFVEEYIAINLGE